MPKARRPTRKEKPLLVITLPGNLEEEIEAGRARLSTTKTALVHRALQTFFHLERKVIEGGEIFIRRADGSVEGLIFP